MSDHLHSFVDEAGDPILFGKKRGSGSIVGNEGCSQYFIMGKLEVYDPDHFSTELHLGKRNSGTFFAGDNVPTLENVFPRNWELKKKKPRI